jgi:hypothetical protein
MSSAREGTLSAISALRSVENSRAYSFAQAARRLGVTEDALRKRAKNGDLEVIDGAFPVSAGQIEDERERLLERLGAIEPGTDRYASKHLEALVETLEAQLVTERSTTAVLRGVITDLVSIAGGPQKAVPGRRTAL